MLHEEQINQIDLLQQVVNETTGTALTLSPKEDKWSGYLLQQKENFEAQTLPELCQIISKHIIAGRVAVDVKEVKEGSKRKLKPYKYSA